MIRQGAMVADRCVLYPGTDIGRNSVIGSGTFCPTNFVAPGGSVWLGNDPATSEPKLWQEGSKEKEDADTLTPYGRAFGKRYAARDFPVGACPPSEPRTREPS